MSFNALVSAAIEQEGTYKALIAEEEERRKRVVSGPSEDSFCGCHTEVPPSVHFISWQVTSATSITTVVTPNF
jgi:hypothetical protein